MVEITIEIKPKTAVVGQPPVKDADPTGLSRRLRERLGEDLIPVRLDQAAWGRVFGDRPYELGNIFFSPSLGRGEEVRYSRSTPGIDAGITGDLIDSDGRKIGGIVEARGLSVFTLDADAWGRLGVDGSHDSGRLFFGFPAQMADPEATGYFRQVSDSAGVFYGEGTIKGIPFVPELSESENPAGDHL